MICPNCGTQLNEDAKFCNKCNTKLKNDKAQQKNKSKKMIVSLISCVVVIALVIGSVVVFAQKNKFDNKKDDSSQQSVSDSVITEKSTNISTEESTEELTEKTTDELLSIINFDNNLFPTLLNTGEFDIDNISNDLILSIGYNVAVQDVPDYLDSEYVEEYGFSFPANEVEKGIEKVFGDNVKYEKKDFTYFSLGKFERFLACGEGRAEILYKSDENKFYSFYGQCTGSFNDIGQILHSVEKSGDEIVLTTKVFFAIGEIQNDSFIYSIYKNLDSEGNEVGLIKENYPEEYYYKDQQWIYKEKPEFINSTDELQACSYTFKKDSSGKYYLSKFKYENSSPNQSDAETTQKQEVDKSKVAHAFKMALRKEALKGDPDTGEKVDISSIRYNLYDIDNDGVVELIINIGICEATKQFRIYRYTEDKSSGYEFVGKFGSGHSQLYSDGSLVCLENYSLFVSKSTITYENKKINQEYEFQSKEMTMDEYDDVRNSMLELENYSYSDQDFLEDQI